MAEDHEPQKLGNSPRPGPEVAERQKIAKERAMQRVRGWSVQNEIRGVLGRVSQALQEGFLILPILER